ncbi:hypothetical protein BDZ91DRAFT_797025 [Kalaharituber pfeilii]|nr:hypothetical protein BDZ91DRAFT_797025 [Kalaharituber pfeilii]
MWYCKKCGFGPHDPSIHLACIMCGAIHHSDLSLRAIGLLEPEIANELSFGFTLTAPEQHVAYSSRTSLDGFDVSSRTRYLIFDSSRFAPFEEALKNSDTLLSLAIRQ